MRAYPEILTPEERARLGLPADAEAMLRREPWPEAQARAEEIVSAWTGTMRPQAGEGGQRARCCEEADTEALAAADDIVAEIARVRAATLRGCSSRRSWLSWIRRARVALKATWRTPSRGRATLPSSLGSP
jgi:hypothetical protein